MDKIETFKLIKSYCPECGAFNISKGFDISGEKYTYMKLRLKCEKCGELSVIRSKNTN